MPFSLSSRNISYVASHYYHYQHYCYYGCRHLRRYIREIIACPTLLFPRKQYNISHINSSCIRANAERDRHIERNGRYRIPQTDGSTAAFYYRIYSRFFFYFTSITPQARADGQFFYACELKGEI